MPGLEQHHALILEFVLSPAYLAGDLDGAAKFLVARLAASLNCDRVMVWGAERRLPYIERVIGAVQAEGLPHPSLPGLPPREFREATRAGTLLRWCTPGESPFAGAARTPIVAAGLHTPIHARGRVIGALCLEMESEGRAWGDDEVGLCSILASHLGLLHSSVPREPEQEKVRSGEVYRRAIAAAGAAPYVEAYDPHVYTFMDEQIAELTGYTPEEFSPQLLRGITRGYRTQGPASGLSFDEAVLRSRKGEFDCWQCDLEIQTKSGEIRWIADISVEIMGADGRSIGSIGLITDITDRVRKQQDVQRVEEIYRRAIAAAGAIPYAESIGSETRYTFLDPRLAELTGYELEQITPAFLGEITVHDTMLGGNEGYSPEEAKARTRRGEVPIWLSDFCVRKSDGGLLWLSDASVELFGADGQSIGSVGLFQDISSRKQAESVLRESEEKYRRIVDTAHEGIWVSNAEKLTTFVNSRMAEMFGRSPGEMLGSPVAEHLFPEDIGKFETQWKCRSVGESGHYEQRWRRKDGTELWAIVSATAVIDEQGHFQGSCAMFTDITDRRRAAAELEHIHTYARCLLWHAEVSFKDGSYHWDISVPNEDAAQRYLPLALRPGQHYFDALIESRGEFEEGGEEQMDSVCSAAFASGAPSYHQEYRIRLQSGETRWLFEDAFIQPLGGRVWRVVGVCTDVTERKQAEDAVRLSETQLLATLENTPNVAIQWYDSEGRVLYWNRASEIFYGWTAEEAIGKTLDKLILSTNEASEFLRILKQIDTTGKAFGPYESFVRHRDGRAGWVLATTFAIPMSTGRTGFVCMDVDITDRKQSDEALRHSESRFRALVENAPEAIVVLDVDQGIFVDCNENACRLCGLSREEMLQKGPRDISPGMHPEGPQSQAFAREKVQAALEGSSIRFEWMIADAQARVIPCEVYLSRMPSASGNLLRGSITDISERKHFDEERERMREHLMHAQKMESVGRLAGGVAHDFNNMLGVILGHVELALAKLDSSTPLFTDLSEIQKAAARSADLTRQLLAFARKQTAAPRVLELNAAVEGVLKMLRRLIGEDIELCWNPGGQLWPIRVDPVQIDQILTNLCVNARDAIAGVGRITIESGKITFDQEGWGGHADALPGDYVSLRVSDTGCGLESDIIPHIFEPFFTTKGLGEGTGLGLATVYGIVRQNGGHITVSSTPAQGTAFCIYLPRCQSTGLQEQDAVQPEAQPPGNETILLVEDELALLNLGRIMIEKLGYKVLAAGSPHEALRLAEEHAGEIDLLVTDVVMPDMNGKDLARRLIALYPDIKRLFMSGYTADVIASHGVLEEGVHFLQKPYTYDTLRLKIREVLDHY